MTRVRGRRALTLLALFASFCAGVFIDGWLRTYGPPQPAGQPPRAVPPAAKPLHAPAEPTVAAAPPPVIQLDSQLASQLDSHLAGHVAGPAGSADIPKIAAAPAAVTGAPPNARLRVPIDGISIESFKGGFAELRGSRPHEAVDIVVPRGTPIHAVQDGTIAKLFFSKAGGTTIYQFDPDGRLCYYYAHLDRYADGLHDGQHVSQGEVIGYVGTSGNAPPGTPHLHFAVFELNAEKQWWKGRAVDPYAVFKEKG